jgi:hypothetical protein
MLLVELEEVFLVDLHGLITVSADVAKELDVLFVID